MSIGELDDSEKRKEYLKRKREKNETKSTKKKSFSNDNIIRVIKTMTMKNITKFVNEHGIPIKKQFLEKF